MENVIDELYKNLRELDRIELEALGEDVRKIIEYSILASEPLYIRRDTSGRLLCVYGLAVAPNVSERVVWMLGTTYLDKYPKKIDMLCREAKFLLDKWTVAYGPLFNYVYEKSEKSIRWLDWLGVEWKEPVTLNGKRFHPFVYGGGK